MTDWKAAQEAEVAFWGSCANTFAEEELQLVAAERMGLEVDRDRGTIQTAGVIADVGGGPISLLLKASGWERAIIVDPGGYPTWTTMRYDASGIEVVRRTGEAWLRQPTAWPSEIWIYNTLQHVIGPQELLAGAVRLAPIVRLFEWVGFPRNDCHLWTLDAKELERWARRAADDVELLEHGLEEIPFAGEANLSYHAVITRRSAQRKAVS